MTMSEGGNRSDQSAAVLEDELEAYCQSDSISERGLRELFERHRLTPGSNQTRLSNYNFFRIVFYNRRVNGEIIRLLLGYFPDAIRSVDRDGCTPLHHLCYNKIEQVDEPTALEILNFLIDKYPEAARHANNDGNLPIHLACQWRSGEFCQVLINAAPDYVRSVDNVGFMPLHRFCVQGDDDEASSKSAVQVLKLLIDKYPEAAMHSDNSGRLPIHIACQWRSDGEFFQVLIHATPDYVRSVDNDGCTPLHYLCENQLEDAAAMQVLNLLIDKYPEAVRQVNNKGSLPIRLAMLNRLSPEFIHVLVKAYPESVRMPHADGKLPLHHACEHGSLATVEYLYQQYPGAIDQAATGEYYPIHGAIGGMIYRYNPATALEIVKFLLGCDPNQKLIQLQGKSLLHCACVEAGIQMIKVLFDAHPEAIENNGITSNIHRFDEEVQAFINSELVYARQASNHRLMMTPDDNGRLPLHTALQNNVRLGSIKLLVKGNHSAIRTADSNLAMPIHVACQYHDSASVVQYLLGLDATVLGSVDRDGNTVLHYACRSAKHDTIALLVEKTSVSKRNADGKLPIDLLWESNEASDRESLEYTESIFRLLRADPEMINH